MGEMYGGEAIRDVSCGVEAVFTSIGGFALGGVLDVRKIYPIVPINIITPI